MRQTVVVMMMAFAAMLGAAAPASADTFYVDDGASASNSSCTLAEPCSTVTKAIAASAASSATPHTVNVAPGTYSESSTAFTSANHTGLQLVGSGSGENPAVDSILVSTSGLFLGAAFGPPQAGMGVRNMRVRSPQNGVNAANSSVRDMVFETSDPASNGTMLGLRAPGQVVERVTIRGGPQSAGIYMQEDTPSTTDIDWTLRDVDVVSGRGVGIEARTDETGNLLLQRARIRVGAGAGSALQSQGPMTVDSALVVGGDFSGVLANTSSPVLMRNVTVDAGVPGQADPLVRGGGPAPYALSGGGGPVRLVSSIVLEAINGSGGGVTCEFSNVRPVNPPGSQCPVGAQGNFTSSPAQLFAAPGADWRLRPDAPAVDAGDPAALVAGESPFDAVSAARVFDGNADGAARRDQGAFESQVAFGRPASPAGPAGGAGPPPADKIRPRVSSARFSPSRFRVGAVSTRVIGGQRRAPRGSILRFRLSEAATARITIERAVTGRRVGRRCLPATRRRRARPRCTRWTAAVTLRRDNVKAGAAAVRFSGRIRGRALRPGRYRAVIVATDRAGNRSRATRAGFSIVR